MPNEAKLESTQDIAKRGVTSKYQSQGDDERTQSEVGVAGGFGQVADDPGSDSIPTGGDLEQGTSVPISLQRGHVAPEPGNFAAIDGEIPGVNL